MAREFNVNFNNVEMIDGMDNLLENTQVTSVTFKGENDLKSLKSTFKGCNQLLAIEGDIDLKEVTAIDCMLEDASPIDVNLINVANENITADKSLNTAKRVIIKGDSYKKDALQNILGSLDWDSDQAVYEGVVGENVFDTTTSIENDNKIVVKDTLEQKAIGFEVKGETFTNLSTVENSTVRLYTKEYFDITEQESSFNTELKEMVINEIVGNTKNVNSVLQSVGELYVDEHGNPILNENGEQQYLIEIKTSDSGGESVTQVLSPQPLRSAGEFNDKIYWDYKEKCYYLEKNVEEIVLNGGENWIQIGAPQNNVNIFATNSFHGLIIPSNLLSNTFSFGFMSSLYNNRKPMYIANSNNYYGAYPDYDISIFLPEETTATNWLNQNPSTIVSALINKEYIKLTKLNTKFKLKTYNQTNVNTNACFPSVLKLSNHETVINADIYPNKTYSFQFKSLGSYTTNDLTSNNIGDMAFAIDNKVNVVNDDIVATNNSVSINCNKGNTDTSCSINFNKLFPSINNSNYQFSCSFTIDSVTTNKSIVLQCEQDGQGYSVNLNPFAGTGRITINYDITNKKHSISVTGAMTYTTTDASFVTTPNPQNAFRILVRNCKITFTNFSLVDGSKVYIGDGEDRALRLSTLTLGIGDNFTSVIPSINNGYSHYNLTINTPSVIDNDYFKLFGDNVKVKDIVILDGETMANQDYFEGTQGVGTTDGDKYFITLSSNNYDISWREL